MPVIALSNPIAVLRTSVRQVGIRQRSLRNCRLGRATELVFILATGVTLALSGGAEAQTWDGDAAGNPSFNEATNWDGDVAPAAGGAVVIAGAGAANQPELLAGDSATVDTVEVSAGTLTIGGDLTVTTGVTVTDSGTVNVSAGGAIIGALLGGGGDATNDGTISAVTSNFGNFTNNGAVTGQMQTNGGTVVLNGGSTVGSLSNISGTTDVSGVVTGAAEVSGGTATLNAGGDIGGAVTVSGGTLTVNVADTVGAVSVSGGTINGAGTLTTTTYEQSGGELAGTVSASGDKTLEGGTISGTLEGAGATTIQTGITTVTGTIAGDVTVAADGTLRIENNNAVSGTITTTGSVISYADGVTATSAVTLNSPTTQLEVLDSDSATQSGDITGANGFEKIGTGSLTVNGAANTYSGTTVISEGNLTAASDSALGTGAATVADGATLSLQGTITTANAITLNGDGGGGGALRNRSDNNVVDGEITLASNARINSDAGQGELRGNITGTDTDLTVGGTGRTFIAGDITTGAGSLTVDATTAGGIVQLEGANTFVGGTTVNSGFLQLLGGSALADGGALTVDAPGTVQIFSGETVGALSGAGTIALQTANALVAGGATGTTTFSGQIIESGAVGTFTKAGAGTLELSGDNSYTGTTTVNAGTLNVTGNIDSTLVNVNTGGTLQGIGTIGGNVTVNDGGTLAPGASPGTLTIAGDLVLSGASVSSFELGTPGVVGGATNDLVDVGGALTLDGTLNVTSAAPLLDGYYRLIEHNGALTNNTLTVGTLPAGASGATVLTNVDGQVNLRLGGIAGIQNWDGGGPFGDGSVQGGNGTWDSTTANWAIGTGVFNDAWGTGTAVFGAAAGSVTVSGVQSYQDLQFDTAGYILSGGTLSGASSEIATNNAGTTTINSVIAGSGGLEKTGAGTLVLGGSNTYSGITTVNEGTLTINGSLDNSGTIAVNNAGILRVNGTALADTAAVTLSGTANLNLTGSETIGSLASAVTTTTVTLGANTLTIDGDGDLAPAESTTFAGVISGDGGLTKSGTDIQVLTGANTYVGATSVTGGGLSVTGATGSLASTVVGVSGTGTLTTDADALAAGATVTVADTGTFTASGADSYTAINQTGGTINGAGTQTLSGTFTQSGGDMGGVVAATGGSTLNGGTISGTLSGADATVQGATATTLTGTISAATTITGTLEVDGGDLTNVAKLDGGTLDGLSDSTLTGTVVADAGGGTVTAATGSTLTITTLNTINGGTLTIGDAGATGTVVAINSTAANAASTIAVDAGTLQIGGAGAGAALLDFTAGTSVAAGANLDIGGFDTTVNALSGTGTVTNSGAAAGLTLTGTSSFGGIIQDGAGVTSLTVAGGASRTESADVTLIGNNTFSGGTTVEGTGALTASLTLQGAGSNLSSTGLVTVNTGGTLVIDGDETIGALAGTGSGAVDISSGTLTTGDASDATYAGTISGAGDLVKNGSGEFAVTGNISNNTVTVNEGTLVLSGTNTMTQITVAGNNTTSIATLRLESDEAAGGTGGLIRTTGSVIDYADGVDNVTDIEIASGTTDVNVTIGAATQSGDIGEDVAPRPLEKTGAGELILSGTNTFTGDMTITEGTLTLVGTQALDDAVDVIVETGAALIVDDSETIASLASSAADSELFIDTGADLTVAGSVDTVYAGTMTGDDVTGLLNDGSGTLTLTGDGSAFTGVIGARGVGSEITISLGGTTSASGVGALAGATFSTDGDALLASNVLLGLEGQATFTGSETVGAVLNSTLTGIATGTITLTGGGTVLTVNGQANALNPSNFNGTNGTVNGEGTLNVTGGSFNIGPTGNVATATTIGAAGAVVNDGTMAGVSNAGTFTNNFNAVTGATAGNLTNTGAGAGSNAGTLASLTHNSSGLFTNTGIITGDTLVSNGTVTLNGASNHGNASTLRVTGGIVNANVADTIGTLDADGGVLNLAAVLTTGTLTGDAGSIVTTAAGQIIAGAPAVSSTFGGSISGAGALQKAGTGTLTMTAANSFTGGTTVSGGVLFLDEGGTQTGVNFTIDPLATLRTDGGALTTVASIRNDGTFDLIDGGDESIANISNSGMSNPGAITLSDGSVLTLNTGLSDITGNISGAGALIVTGTSDTRLSGTNSHLGDTTLENGTLTLTNGAAISDAAALVVNGGLLEVATAESVGSLRGTGGTVDLNGNALTVLGAAPTATTYQGIVAGGAASLLSKNGAGTLTLTGDSTMTGTMRADTGTIEISGGGSTQASFVSAASGGTFRTAGGTLLNATVGVIGTGTGAIVFGGSETVGGVNLASGATLAQNAGVLTINGTATGASFPAAPSGIAGAFSNILGVVSGAGGLTLTGGEATLANTNTYSGTTSVAGGTLNLANGAAIIDSGVVTVTGGRLEVTANETIGSLAGSVGSFIDLNASRLTFGSLGATTTIASVIQGAGGVTLTGGTVTMSQVNSYTGLTEVNGGSTLFLSGELAGAVDVGMSSGTGTFNVTGGTVAGLTRVTTGSTVNLSAGGALNGGLTNTGGVVNLLASNAGTISQLTNSSGTVNIGNGATLDGNVTNAGTFNLTSATVDGANFDNASALNVVGGSTIASAFSNTGTLNLAGVSGTGDSLTVDSVSVGNLGSVLANLDLSTPIGASDSVTSTAGGITAANLTFTVTGNELTEAITVLSGLNANATLTSNLVSSGSISRILTQNGDLGQVVSLVNPAISGIASAASITQSLIASIVNRPTSPFVSGLAAEETCSSGGYARGTGGIATVTGTARSNDVSVSNDLNARYFGLQGGYDFGCFDGRYANGWDGAIGIMGGVNYGSTEQDVFVNPLNPASGVTGTSGSDFDQTYFGIYAAASRDKISGDLQIRFDNTDFTLKNTTGIGFDGEKFSTTTSTIGARFNYRATLNEEKGISLVPTIGFNYSRTTGDTVTFNADGIGADESLVLDPFNSFIGFFGATLAQTTVSPTGTSATTMFASGNYYNDFSGDRKATFNDEFGAANPITLDGIGGFAEASLGINFVKVLDNGPAGAKQLNANIRADARFGENVSDAYSLTAQVRLSF